MSEKGNSEKTNGIFKIFTYDTFSIENTYYAHNVILKYFLTYVIFQI